MALFTVSQGGTTRNNGWGIVNLLKLGEVSWAACEDEGVYPKNHYTNRTVKVIPTIIEGNWAVRNVMPSNKPCILGQKVQQRYFKGPNYVEIDVDIGSSSIACNIMGIIRNASKHCKAGYAIILQGTTPSELPEKVLASQDGDRADFAHLKNIDAAVTGVTTTTSY
jgi:hypothetical protein